MILVNIVILLACLVFVCLQARGRSESILLWGSIYCALGFLFCLIPNHYLVLILGIALSSGITACMGPWKRKVVFIGDLSGRPAHKIKEDYSNIVGVAEDEDVHVVDLSRIIADPIAIKGYDNVIGQEELWNDLKKLKENKIRYDVKSGLLTTLFVNARDADNACAVLGITVPTVGGPSEN